MGSGSSRHQNSKPRAMSPELKPSSGNCKATSMLSKGKNKIHNSTVEITDVTDLDDEEEDEYKPNLGFVEDLTDEEKQILESTWMKVENDAERIGAVTFVNLFEMHPGVKDHFIPFKSIDVKNERYNRILRNHGLRVLKTVGKMIHRVKEDSQKMINIVRATGTRHRAYNAEGSLIDVMCPHFVKAIEGTLGESWSTDVEAAYKHLFQILSLNMREALLIAQHEDRKAAKKQQKKS